MSAKRPPMDPDLRSMLGRHREELLRRALALAVSRGSLDDLVERPLGDRLGDLELVFEAAGGVAADPAAARHTRDLQAELGHQLDSYRRNGQPFAVAVVASGTARIGRMDGEAQLPPDAPDAQAWRQALAECAAAADVVIDAGDGATAIVLPDHDRRDGSIAADRLRRAAWRLLGQQGPLAGLGVAACPEDGSSPYEILAGAYDALWRQAEFDVVEPEPLPALRLADGGPTAPAHPLRPA